MLSNKGKIIGDFTISCLDETRFQLTASYGSQAYHMRWFDQQAQAGATLKNISDTRTGFQIAGPKAHKVLQAVTHDQSNMKFMDTRFMTIGMAPCIVQRLSYTGDLGFEIYTDAMYQQHLWETLWDAGLEYGMKPFGMRAMMSLRLDRLFGSWMREFSPDYTPAETGLDRFIDWNHDFIGKLSAKSDAPNRRLVAFEIEADDADVQGYEPIWHDGKVVGFCTSGGYSHHMDISMAMGFLPLDLEPETVEIEILGEMRAARVLQHPLFDPDGTRMRG